MTTADDDARPEPGTDGAEPIWNGVDADFYLPQEDSRGWFGFKRRARDSDTSR
ncbi:hypothetical protein [Microbacterium sp. MPKO10]|uniref:hypothetical protein n=1 Tax=Microbacterium sp. MPKO10 TaxID=2989818 RepID=UPI0022369D2D|nr:hypothetical protein [Microbacterium sp. MPKO10]MCW4456681.1 hypothetical protein [Microbacterium sp. MPKO10]